MVERKRWAIDVAGQRVTLIEREAFSFVKTANGWTKQLDQAAIFATDGEKLIPEGDDFFKTKLGVRYKLMS